jgi:hypothetical protein
VIVHKRSSVRVAGIAHGIIARGRGEAREPAT